MRMNVELVQGNDVAGLLVVLGLVDIHAKCLQSALTWCRDDSLSACMDLAVGREAWR